MRSDDMTETPIFACREVITCQPNANITDVANILQNPMNTSEVAIDTNRLSNSTASIVKAHEDTLLKLATATYRVFLEKVHPVMHIGASGQVAPVAPGLWLSCNHVVNAPQVSQLYYSNGIITPYTLVSHRMATEMSVPMKIDKSYLDKLVINDQDPITGKKIDLLDFNLALIESENLLIVINNFC